MSDPIVDAVALEFCAADRDALENGRWVMDRPHYDRLRAASVSEEQERARAAAHYSMLVSIDNPPDRCPVCGTGPLNGLNEIFEHGRLASDPQYREPQPGDHMFGLPVEVREDGGEPHIESGGS